MSLNKAIHYISQEDFNFLIKNGKRESSILGHDLKSLIHSSYKFVKEILPDLIKNSNFDDMIFNALKDRGINVFRHEVERLDPNKALEFICFLVDELELIGKLEQEYLSSEPDIDMQAAGVSELNQFGDMNIIDTLAGGDILKWEQVKSIKYKDIFDKQYKMIIEGRIQKKLAKNLSKKKI